MLKYLLIQACFMITMQVMNMARAGLSSSVGTACSCILMDNATYPMQPNASDVTIDVPPIYLIQAIFFSIMFPVSLIGTILSILCICRRKTDFLLRVFVYVSITITLLLGVHWLYNVSAFKAD